MSKNKKINDEIDLIKLIILILNHKLSILIITSVTLLSYYIINIPNFSKKNFEVKIGYNIIFHPDRIVELCGKSYKCMHEKVSNEIMTMLSNGWSLNLENQTFLFFTSSPKSQEKYLEDFDKINKTLTEEIYDSAVNEVNEINKIYDQMQQDFKDGKIPELNYPFNDALLKSKRLIYSIDYNGKKAIDFSLAHIREIPNDYSHKLITAFIVGIIISILYVFVINGIKRFKKL